MLLLVGVTKRTASICSHKHFHVNIHTSPENRKLPLLINRMGYIHSTEYDLVIKGNEEGGLAQWVKAPAVQTG